MCSFSKLFYRALESNQQSIFNLLNSIYLIHPNSSIVNTCYEDLITKMVVDDPSFSVFTRLQQKFLRCSAPSSNIVVSIALVTTIIK